MKMVIEAVMIVVIWVVVMIVMAILVYEIEFVAHTFKPSDDIYYINP